MSTNFISKGAGGICQRQRVTDTGCIYGSAVVGRKCWQRLGALLFSDCPSWMLGGYAVIQNCKRTRYKGMLYSVSDGDGGEKCNLVGKL